MATFADLMSLLLTFFVLLLSFASVEQSKFNVAMTSLRGALGVLNSRQGAAVPISNMPMFQIGKGRIDQVVEQMVDSIQSELKAMGIMDMLQVSQNRERLHFTISEPLLFSPGSADLNPAVDPLMSIIAEILNMVPFEVRVEGHTDNIPISTARFPSNWELSFARGKAMAEKFMQYGVSPSRFQIIGYGEYRPVADNDTPAGRGLNRRVEIIVNLRDEIRRSLIED
jgi:chemotaxis protein MotB